MAAVFVVAYVLFHVAAAGRSDDVIAVGVEKVMHVDFAALVAFFRHRGAATRAEALRRPPRFHGRQGLVAGGILAAGRGRSFLAPGWRCRGGPWRKRVPAAPVLAAAADREAAGPCRSSVRTDHVLPIGAQPLSAMRPSI